MTAIFKNAKYILAMAALGLLLTGCNRNTGSEASPGSNSGAPASPAPAPETNAPPPAPAPAPAPDTSATTPPASPGGDTSSTPSGTSATAGAAVDDTVITTKVKAALLADSDVKAADIHVDTANGDVTLSGTAASQAQIDKAVGIVRGIEGVKNVDNKLAVKAG